MVHCELSPVSEEALEARSLSLQASLQLGKRRQVSAERLSLSLVAGRQVERKSRRGRLNRQAEKQTGEKKVKVPPSGTVRQNRQAGRELV